MQEWDGPTVYLMSVIYSKNFVSLILHLPLQHECFQQPQPLERVSQPQRYTFPCCLRASNAPKCANEVHRSIKAKNASNARRTLQQNLFNFEPREYHNSKISTIQTMLTTNQHIPMHTQRQVQRQRKRQIHLLCIQFSHNYRQRQQRLLLQCSAYFCLHGKGFSDICRYSTSVSTNLNRLKPSL